MTYPKPPADTSWVSMTTDSAEEWRKMVDKLKRYAKFVSAFVAAVVAGAVGVFDDGHVSGVVEWTVLITAVANAVNVFVTPELKAGAARMAKGLTAVAFALAGAVTPAVVAGGIDSSEKFMLASVVLGALGALGVPNVGYRYAIKDRKTITGHSAA